MQTYLKERFHVISRRPCQCFITEGETNPQKLYSSSLKQTHSKSSSLRFGISKQAVTPAGPGDWEGLLFLNSFSSIIFSWQIWSHTGLLKYLLQKWYKSKAVSSTSTIHFTSPAVYASAHVLALIKFCVSQNANPKPVLFPQQDEDDLMIY